MASDIDIGTMFGAGGGDTFMGLPPCFDVTQIEAKIGLIGVPCATPYPSVGPYCSGAPAAMRAIMSHYGDNLHHILEKCFGLLTIPHEYPDADAFMYQLIDNMPSSVSGCSRH